MSEGILCQHCGIEAPVRKVTFHQNIGMLVMRQSRTVDGFVCKGCLHERFWVMTGTTLGIGWLGTISLILTPIFIINNVVYYLTRLGMPPVPATARKPMPDDAAVARMDPHMESLFVRVEGNEPLMDVCRDIAPRANVTPGEVLVYAIAIAQGARQQAQQVPQQRGFDVIAPPPPLPGLTANAAIAPPPMPVQPVA
jgi:hypothetical protein